MYTVCRNNDYAFIYKADTLIAADCSVTDNTFVEVKHNNTISFLHVGCVFNSEVKHCNHKKCQNHKIDYSINVNNVLIESYLLENNSLFLMNQPFLLANFYSPVRVMDKCPNSVLKQIANKYNSYDFKCGTNNCYLWLKCDCGKEFNKYKMKKIKICDNDFIINIFMR